VRRRWNIFRQGIHPSEWNLKFFIGSALALLVVNLLGPKGFVEWALLRQEKQRVDDQNAQFDKELAHIKRETRLFQMSEVARERAIRQELGFLKAEEVSIELPESEHVSTQ